VMGETGIVARLLQQRAREMKASVRLP